MDIVNKLDIFVDNIKRYFNGNSNVLGSQNIIGFKQLFCGYVVKDWFGSDENQKK